MTLSTIVEQVRSRLGERPAFADSDGLTYGRLVDIGRRLVDHIAKATGEERPRIAVILNNRWEYPAIDLGCASQGAVLVRCNARDSAADLAYIVDDSQCHALVYSKELQPTVDRALEICGSSPGPYRVELPPRRSADRREFVESLASDVPIGDVRWVQTSRTDAYRLMYTSGTTGDPKGVVVTHDQWRSAVIEHMFMEPLHDVPREPSFLHVTPLSHVSGGLFWSFMMMGAKQVIASGTDVEEMSELASRYRVTHTFLVPTLIGRILDAPDSQTEPLNELQRIYYAASPIEPDRLRDAVATFGPIFAQGYGSTEAMWWLTYFTPEAHQQALDTNNVERMASCGRPAYGVDLGIADDDGNAVPAGDLGEIVTKGRHVARQYWGRGKVPLIEEGPFEGWFRMGDVGYADNDGFIYLMDRKSDLIVSGGFNVYPREVERILTDHPKVVECCVVGIPDKEWGERITAVVVPEQGETIDPEEIIAFGTEHLAGYKRPRQVEIRDELPTTATGKLDRKAVRNVFWEGRGRGI